MRIGISVNTLYEIDGSPKQYDGMGSYTRILIQGLSAHHHIEKVIAPAHLKFFLNPSACLNTNLTVLPHLLKQTFSPFSLSACQQFEAKIDLYHSTDYFTCKFNKIPVVSTLHDAILFDPHYTRKNFFKARLGPQLLKRFSKNAHHIMTPSQAVVPDLIEKWGIPSHKISVVPPGIDPIWNTTSVEKIDRLKTLYHIQKEYFLVVGTLQPRKNIARILQAYQISSPSFKKQYQILFVGNRGWLDSSTFDLLQKMQAQGWVRWLNYIPFPHLQCLYQNATAILFPSLNEGFGYPILEGFASRRPVITSHYGAMAEVAGDSALLVDPTNISAIQEGMETIVSDYDLQNTLIRNGQKRLNLFTVDQFIARTYNVYAQVKEEN